MLALLSLLAAADARPPVVEVVLMEGDMVDVDPDEDSDLEADWAVDLFNASDSE